MMAVVRLAEKKIWVDQTPVPLISGELHYWRLDPHQWRPALERVREMGIRTVATYACWDFHQVAPGEFDLNGKTDPRRNVVGFLELLTEMGFWIIFRPGPYIYAEWTNGGVPDEAARYHRLSPEFQALAEPWMTAITLATRPFLATNGGRIIVWQSDNEIDAWPHLYTEPLGLGRSVGVFHDFLRQKYDDVHALNVAWQTQYRQFEDARAVSELFRDEPLLIARYNDFRAFLHWFANQVASWGVGFYRELGVDVPIVLNAYSGVSNQLWPDLEAIGDLVGADIYPSREYLYRAGEQRHVMEAVRYARSFSKLPYVAEFEAGIWHDWLVDVGAFTPNHYRLICLGALLAGAAGWNWYMLVNRDNWTQSPINEWGRIRPDLFAAFQQITRLYDRLDPTTLEKVAEIAVTFDPLQRSTTRPGQDLLQSLYDADLDYEFFDLDGSLSSKPVVFYAGGSWLSAKGQQRLVEYVEQGGHLICIGAVPTRDEHMQPINRLDLREADGIISADWNPANFRLFGHSAVESPWWHSYDTTPGEPIIVTRLPYVRQPSEELKLQFGLQEGLAYTIGYTVERGRGKISVIGLKPTASLLLALCRHFDVKVACRSLVGGIASALFTRDGTSYLLATNDGNEAKAALIEIAPGILPAGDWWVEDLESGMVSQVTLNDGGVVPVQMARKDGVALRLTRDADA